MSQPLMIILSFVGFGLFIFAIVTLCNTFFIVEQQSAEIVQRLGKFKRVALAGFGVKIPFIDSIAGNVSLRVQQLNVNVETKTKDNVFVTVKIAVQYFVKPDKIYEAFYKLSDIGVQVNAFVFDVVRSTVPGIELDDVFLNKDNVAAAVKKELSEVMDDFGYEIVKALVTDIDPDAKVKAAMNEINAAQRLRVAAQEKGEADKILRIKAAEAEAESKRLQGEGIAKERAAIVHGLRASMEDMKIAAGPDSSPQEVMNLLLLNQYFDTIKSVGANDKTTTILVPHTPGFLGDLAGQLRNALVTAGQIDRGSDQWNPPIK